MSIIVLFNFYEMDENERCLRYKLSRVKGLGSVRFKQVINKFGSVGAFLRISRESDLGEMCNSFARDLLSGCYDNEMIGDMDQLKQRDIQYVVFGESSYPEILTSIYDPPPVLYYKGDIKLLNKQKNIAIVGTRRFSEYGQYLTKKLVEDLKVLPVTIVSGMAFGIDRLAHERAMKEGMPVIAVLATPPDIPSPRSNYDIYRKILEKGGLVISEYLRPVKFNKGNFAARNRIIAGISDSIFIVESPQKSGALITADVAFRENRNVYTFPADIRKKNFEGNNSLIYSQKACVIANSNNLYDQLGCLGIGNDKIRKKYLGLDEEILKKLEVTSMSEEGLLEEFDISSSDLLASLSLLELDGAIKKADDGKFCIII